MRRLFLVWFILAGVVGAFGQTSDEVRLRFKSTAISADGVGAIIDKVDGEALATFLTGTEWGPLSGVYHTGGILASSQSITFGLVGSLTSPVSGVLSFASIKGFVVQSLSGTQTLAIFAPFWSPATWTVSPYGFVAIVGSYSTVPSASAVVTLTNSVTGSHSYNLWIAGTQ